jgi:glycosyltransferase involved in cell wall biosynthesis
MMPGRESMVSRSSTREEWQPRSMDERKPDISIVIPVYNDETTIRHVVEKAIEVLRDAARQGEIVVVDDGSPDRSGAIGDELAKTHALVRVAHHASNLGYGAAFKTGVAHCRFEWICMVDGDNEYDVSDLKRMLALRQYYPLIIAFRYRKLYSATRIFVSHVYNAVLRFLFRSPFRDVSTGIRIVHRSILDEIDILSDSPFVGAELAIKAMLRGFPVGEVGIQTFPRTFGRGSATSFSNIVATIRDIYRMRKEVFSPEYSLPEGRGRS